MPTSIARSPALPHSPLPASTRPPSARLVAIDGRDLPLRSTRLSVDACGGLARVVLEQRFHNPHREALTVSYSLPLPADGAVSGFGFTIGAERVVGRVEPRGIARERYEEALMDGRTASLLEEDRTSLFRQEVGNVPPGEEIVIEVQIDQPLAFIDGADSGFTPGAPPPLPWHTPAGGSWEWRFPTVLAPRYLGEEGRTEDADRIGVEVGDAAIPARVKLDLLVRDVLRAGAVPVSPSHALSLSETKGALRVTLGGEGARLDRDVVVRWAVGARVAGASLDRARVRARGAGAAYGLLTLVPPEPAAPRAPVPRDLIVLLDTSGSMAGEPLEQAKRVTLALVQSLGANDRLELIEFSSQPRRFSREPLTATDANKKKAIEWVRSLRAAGGTEMRDGIVEALRTVREEAQRQVLLVTDGLIGFEREIVEEVRNRLPRGCRVHVLGIGSGVNRSLTTPVAEAGNGVEAIAAPGEDVEPLVARLAARMCSPIIVDVEVSGSALEEIAGARLPDLYAGAPSRVSLRLRAEGGELVVRGRAATGSWEQRLAVPPTGVGEGSEAVVVRFGRQSVEALENGADAGDRDQRVERLGLEFQIATRLTSWVAATEEQMVDPTRATRRVTMPHELPHRMSAEGLGLRSPSAVGAFAGAVGALARTGMVYAAPVEPAAMAPAPALSVPPSARGTRASGEEQAAVREPVAKSGGVLGAIGRAVFGAAEPSSRDDAPTPRRLRGRIARRTADRLVIEVELDAALDWARPAEVELLMKDGQVVRASVETGKSTQSGALGAGLALRLVVVLGPASSGPVSEVRVDSDVVIALD